MTQQYPPAWHPDPTSRHQQRYWDGTQWTSIVSDNGQTLEDTQGQELANTGQATSTGIIDSESFGYTTPTEVQVQVAKAMTATGGLYDALQVPDVSSTEVPPPNYSKNIFTENIIVVNQVAKLFELTSEYGIYDQYGEQIGYIRQVGQSAAKKAARMLTGLDSMMTHHLEIYDMAGNVSLRVAKPRAVFKGKLIVENAQGQELGELDMIFRIGKAQLKILSNNQLIGMIYAQNFRAWDFSIEDSEKKRIGSVTKTWEGFAKAIFTTADNYVLQIHEEIQEPLKSLVLASALAIDMIYKQNDKGFG